ncbi:MAG TPA: single-stranded DNA-binding protein [Bacteroidales bacterium]|jgi:single-strand DNA-binding protein|nr:MAG: Single-stranded DNA-binding protein [Bacteroidetes bacterium ADurb.Bin041]HNV49379.1 single-stranded DNA-binding protein [Bacteroidales bacterium]HPW42301.1 single-stranded DNA-binding protein [Bacteroidales bacterium]HQF01054.1 single-stranded DNA-binding protein [Bacteroidales bacterium]HQH14201.1 single-stranded DNA-binding protein [Bacteroidales bacterium]
MKSLRNSVQLIGNLGMDPEVKQVSNGNKMARFSLATTETYKNQRGEKVTDTQWHNIIIWGGLADVAEKYLKKGKQIAIEGRLETNAYDDNEGKRRFFTQVNVNDLVMLGKESN